MSSPQPTAYTVVPLIGPDGVGKTTLAAAIGAAWRRSDHAGVTASRSVVVAGHSANVFELRSGPRIYQFVDFADNAAEHRLIASTRFQGAVLVVSARDSVMPDTVKSLMHAREAGVPRIVVALSFCDAVEDSEMLDLITLEIRELLVKHHVEGEVPVIQTAALPALQGSERWMQGNTALVRALDSSIR